MDRHGHVVGVSDLSLVDGVIHQLEDHVVEPQDVVGVSDIHPGPFPDGLEAFQELDRIGRVSGAHVCHE